MSSVRAYDAEDAKAVKHICHATATDKKFRRSFRLVTALYCDYYIEKEPRHCFVLTDEFDKAAGYVLCSVNDDNYQKNFAPYLKTAAKISKTAALGHILEQKLTSDIRARIPAHLHIDILPSFQGKGGGRALIDALCEHLRAEGINGVRLTVGAGNAGAIAFYERLGFERKKSLFKTAYVYTKQL